MSTCVYRLVFATSIKLFGLMLTQNNFFFLVIHYTEWLIVYMRHTKKTSFFIQRRIKLAIQDEDENNLINLLTSLHLSCEYF